MQKSQGDYIIFTNTHMKPKLRTESVTLGYEAAARLLDHRANLGHQLQNIS